MYFSGALHPSLFLSFALSMLVMQNRYWCKCCVGITDPITAIMKTNKRGLGY
jgi:hypothetical protein